MTKVIFFSILCYLFLPFCNAQAPPPIDINDVTAELVNNGVVTPGCSSVDAPFLLQNDSKISISRYLARAANVEKLIQFIVLDQLCYVTPPYTVDLGISENCTPPYDKCWGGRFCPETYSNVIEALVKMNIQFLARVAKASYVEDSFKPGRSYYEKARQIVIDVNAAYDCAGLRRPIIQAGVMEDVSERLGNDNVEIPQEVIDFFISEGRIPASDLAHYQNSGVVYFDRGRMGIPQGKKIPNILYVETQMWFYYQAKTYIDFGYNSLHLGLYWLYAHEDFDDEGQKYPNLYWLTNAMRKYASSQGSFVIINGENPAGEDDNGESAFYNNQLIFDFDGRATRFRELSNPNVLGDGVGCNSVVFSSEFYNIEGCEEVSNPDFLNASTSHRRFLLMQPTLNALPAKVDPCSVESHGGSVGGICPRGNSYDRVPYFAFFDFGSGVFYEKVNGNYIFSEFPNTFPVGFPQNMPQPIASGNVGYDGSVSTKTWGFDDTKWFAETLSAECRMNWWKKYYTEMRSYHQGLGFFQVPAMLTIKSPENYSAGEYPLADGLYVIADEPDFVDLVAETLEPKKAHIEHRFIPCIEEGRVCDTQIVDHEEVLLFEHYGKIELGVGNVDNSSVYSWHVQRPDGSWMPSTTGFTRTVILNEDGEYTFYLRQDNLGFPIDEGISITSEIKINNRVCCQLKNEKPKGKIFTGNSDMKIYPNPANDILNVEYVHSNSSSDYLRLSIMNMFGQTIKTFEQKEVYKGNNLMALNIKELKDGSYLLVVESKEYIESKRIIKQSAIDVLTH